MPSRCRETSPGREVAARRRARAVPGSSEPGGRVEVDAVRRVQLDRLGRSRRTRWAARRVGAGERARERGERAVAGRDGAPSRGLSHRRCGAARRRARAAGGAAARRASSPVGGGEQAVQVVAREVRAPRERGAVRAVLVERVEHQVDQVAQAVRHAHSLIGIRRPDWTPRPLGRVTVARMSCLVRLRRRRARARRARAGAGSRRTRTKTLATDAPATARRAHLGHGVPSSRTASCGSGRCGRRVKARDLQRDPRFALHSGDRGPGAVGAARRSSPAIAEEITRPGAPSAQRDGAAGAGGPSHLFRLDVTRGLDRGPQRGPQTGSWSSRSGRAERGVRTIERA